MILAIETSTDVCGVALVQGQRVVSRRSVVEKNVHSEKLLPLIDEVFREAAIEPRALDAIAVSIGPGSFTGLRIGLSTAKGLALALGKPIIPVPTLDALAAGSRLVNKRSLDAVLCPLIDAKRNEAFYSFYTSAPGGVRRLAEYQIAPASRIIAEASVHSSVMFVGDGIKKIQAEAGFGSSMQYEEKVICDPVFVGMLAETEGTALHLDSFATLEPMYLREFVTTVPRVHAFTETTGHSLEG